MPNEDHDVIHMPNDGTLFSINYFVGNKSVIVVDLETPLL